MSACLDAFYTGKAQRDRIRQQTQDLMRKLKNEIEKNEKKVKILRKELAEAEKAEDYRMFGELLTACLHQVKRGDSEARVINYYDPEAPEITIPLDPALSPSENAQRWFKKYNKAKAVVRWNREQIEKAEEDIRYLESVLVQLENANLRDVEEIREELEEQGWLKPQTHRPKRKKKEAPSLTTVYSSDGTPILIGRNNKQNDYLTHQLAHVTDTWLHTKDIPGSHVVIRSKQVSEQTLREAAMLAAWFSKARESSQVPVDYTLIKHVKKPSSARPGFVIYEQQKTLYVTPDEDKVQELLKRTKPPV
jgi:predicted ribosome quality control (RQC) complex YloA/Tae2 family protein